jgi:hypothetical protein
LPLALRPRADVPNGKDESIVLKKAEIELLEKPA